MANPDKPRGFKPVRHLNGASWNNALATRAIVDDVDFDDNSGWMIGIGTPVITTDETPATIGVAEGSPLESAVAVVPLTDEDNAALCYGVVVGIGNLANGDTLNQETGPWDGGDQLSASRNYLTTAEVEADPDGNVLYIAPAKDWIFEVLGSETAEAYAVGAALGLMSQTANSVEVVDTTTGYSSERVGIAGDEAGNEAQFRVVEIPAYVDNSVEEGDCRIHGLFIDAWPAVESQ